MPKSASSVDEPSSRSHCSLYSVLYRFVHRLAGNAELLGGFVEREVAFFGHAFDVSFRGCVCHLK